VKLFLRFLFGLLILAIALGTVWVIAKYRASPPPAGEAYRLVPEWPRLPENLVLGQVSGVDVASNGDVYVFHRAERFWGGEEIKLEFIASPTVLVLNSETGEVITQWGEETFVMPHGLTVDDQDNVWLTDVGLHQVFKLDAGGAVLMTLGERGVPGEDAAHFNMPTDVAIAPDGSFYVSDGYVNSRITRFSRDGEYITRWGTKGTDAGEFDVPHSIALDSQGRVYVADRGNARIQIFDETGQFIEEWKDPALGSEDRRNRKYICPRWRRSKRILAGPGPGFEIRCGRKCVGILWFLRQKSGSIYLAAYDRRRPGRRPVYR
jgi:DNA-binding beta-propeller fold protein YncE